MRAYDVVDKKLQKRWLSDFDTNNNLWSAYAYQGNHNYTIADVDGDGRDEIVYGSMTVDDNGRGLYSTGYGHGDAMHVSDFDPYHRGLEILPAWKPLPTGELPSATAPPQKPLSNTSAVQTAAVVWQPTLRTIIPERNFGQTGKCGVQLPENW